MAKSLLLSVLVDVLGKYVEGLTSENLKLGVFSGKIEFHNLNLKDSALDELNLPIQVKKGALKHLRVKVPWTQLESKPVEIYIDGVYLLAAPLDLSQCTPDISRKMVYASKQKKLKEVDDAILISLTKEKSSDAANSTKSASYLQQLATCILDNLEITLTNVHIRYEDPNSDNGRVFCAGVTLDEVILTGSDETWTAKFVKRDAIRRSDVVIRKIGKLNNCGIYWNSQAQSHLAMSQLEWEEVMEALIFKSTGKRNSEKITEMTQYILAPPNNLTLKITHREHCTESIPNVDMVIDSSEMPFKVDKDQFRQFMLMLKSFGDLDRKRQMALYRPAVRPKVNVSAREWWRYAFRLVTGRDFSLASKIKLMKQCMQAKDKYISYIKQNQINGALARSKGGSFKPQFEEEIRSIEETIPLVSLIIFREEAVKAALLEIQRQSKVSIQEKIVPKTSSLQLNHPEEKKAENKESKKGFFSNWFSSSKSPTSASPVATTTNQSNSNLNGIDVLSPKSALKSIGQTEDDEDFALMGDIENRIHQLAEQSSAAITQMFSFRLSVASSAKLELTYNQSPIVKLQMALAFGMEMRYSNMSLKFDMNNFSVEDICSTNPYNKDLVCMASVHEIVSPSKLPKPGHYNRSQFELTFDIQPNKSVLTIRALPLLVTWNKSCVQQLLAFIIVATADDSYVNSNRMLRNSMDRFAAEAALPKSDFFMKIDIDAPKVILPDDMGNSERCTIFDAGTLSLDGLLNANGMVWDIKLQKINVAMPFTRQSIHLSGSGTVDELYLVKPFDVSVKIQNTNKSSADLSVLASVDPEIQAEFNAQKIVRLFQAVAEIVSSIDTSKVESKTTQKKSATTRRSSMISTQTPKSMEAAPMPVAVTASKQNAAAIDKNVVNVLVTFLLDKLALRLNFSENHFAELSFTGIQCKVSQRIFDQTVSFSVNSLMLTDSQRVDNYNHVILAQPDTNDSNLTDLFSLTLRMFNSKNSPLYEGNAMELYVHISVINLFIDDQTTLGYKILVDELLTSYKLYFKGIGEESSKVVSDGSDHNKLKKKVVSPPNPLGGMLLDFAIERVSLHILDTHLSKGNSNGGTEIAFSVHMNVLRVNLLMGELFKGSALLHSIELVDVRSATGSQVFRKLFGTDIFKYEDPDNVDQIVVPSAQEMLRIDFEQATPNVMNIDFRAGHITVFIAVDVIVDLVAMMMANVNALIEVIYAFSMDSRSKEVLDSFSSPDVNTGNTFQSLSDPSSDERQELFLRFNVDNPQLLLVEDPYSVSSRAIVNKCKLKVMYRRIVKEGTQELEDVAHVAIEDSEIFVVGDLSVPDSIHRIVDPMSIEVHSSNRLEKGMLLEMKTAISSTNEISIRVSLNDLMLAYAIINRFGQRKVVPSSTGDDRFAIEDDKNHYHHPDGIGNSLKTTENVKLSKTDVSVYNIKSTITRVQIILINDCNGQNNPLLRLEAAEADFAGSGPLVGFYGDGSIVLKMDYYNVPMNVWEPVMERWQPSLKLVKDFSGTDILLKFHNAVQINITGTLLKCVMNAVSLISKASNERDDENRASLSVRYSTRRTVPPLRISNQLGVDIELFDASKEKSLLVLVDSEMHPIPDSTAISNFDFSLTTSDWSRPRMFYVLFKGELEGKLAPLRQLSSAALKKPKIYHLQPGSDFPISNQATVPIAGRAIAPVTVDLYQYQRYNIVTQRWEAPWGQVGDPHEFADGLGKGKFHPSKITLPQNWMWVESDWKIDLSGDVGKEIDIDGWEYASNFSFFTLNNKRRTKLPTDLVRRRRWIRTRVYKSDGEVSDNNLLLGANVVWDVVAKPDESKEIYVRTSKIVVNELPVALEIGMGSSYKGATEVMTSVLIDCGGKICIPLRCMNECVVRIRPAGLGFTWSEEIPIVLEHSRQEKIMDFKRVVCLSLDQIPILLGTMAEEKDGFFTLTCTAMVHVVNRLPCSLSFGFRNLEGKYDQIALPAGDSCKLMNCNVGSELELTPSIGVFSRSEKVKLPGINEQVEAILKLSDSRSSRFILCTVRLSINHQGVATVTIFSKMLVFDRTGLCASTSTATDRRDYQLESVTYNTEELWYNFGIQSMNSSDYWIYGTHGMSIFQPVNDKLNIWVNKGRAQLNDVETESLSSSKSKLELYDPSNNMQYSIALQLLPYPAAPDLCQVLHITPAFFIVNAMNENEFVMKQSNGEGEDFYVRPSQSRAWHATGRGGESTVLYVRTSHSDWSIGTVNINDIGTTVLALPRKNCGGPDGRDPVIVNVDVRFSDNSDPSYITVTVWESKMWKVPETKKIHRLGTITFSIRNDSNEVVIAKQHAVDTMRYLKKLGRLATEVEAAKYELTIPPDQWLAYGWSDQDVDPKIEIYCGSSAFEKPSQSTKVVVLDTNKVGQSALLNDRVKVQVKTNPHGKYLHVEPIAFNQVDDPEIRKQNIDPEVLSNLRMNDLSLRIQLDCIAVSLIADRPKRREFFNTYLSGIQFSFNQIFESEYENATTMMSFLVSGAQIDNYSQTIVYPVLLSTPAGGVSDGPPGNNSSKIGNEKGSDNGCSSEMQFLEFSLVRENPKDQLMPIIKYVGFRMLEARISIDSATILLYMSDLHRDLLEGASQIDSEEFSSIPATESFNNSMVKLSKSTGMEDTKRQYEQAQGDKIIIELLEIHPMKVVVNFSPSHYPRSTKEIPPALRWMTKIETVSAVEEFEVRIKSFIARDAMESVVTLTDRVLKKIASDLLNNLLGLTRNLVGSLNALGKPAGLYKKVGSGVGDFFYEPYQGLMQSPVKFVKGLGKGTGKLIKGVGGGVVGSTATIVGTASGGVASVARNVVALSGDNKFIQRQEEKRREMKMNNGGALAGFKAAGESVFSGFSSGLTGLVTAPLEETKKSGPMGFFVGVGKGIVGAAVKPVVGVTEGISSVATGINQQFSNAVIVKHKRPPRALLRPDITSSDVILIPLDGYAAFAQEFVNKRAFKKNYTDSFLLALSLGYNPDKIKEDVPFGVVLSMKYVFVLSKAATPLWMMAVSTISHVCLIRTETQHYGLQFVEYVQGKSGENPNIIPFAHRGMAIVAYDYFVRYRTLFGYPSLMEPSELVLPLLDGTGSSAGSVCSSSQQLQRSASLSSAASGQSLPGSVHGCESNHGGSVVESGRGTNSSTVQPIPQGKIPHHYREYAFGSANGTKYDNQRMSDQQFRMIAERYFSKIHIQLPIPDESRSDYHHYLDHILWRAVSDWNYNHDFIINPSRCCASLIINHTKSFVQILDIELKEGVQVLTFGIGEGYDPNGRIIQPDGGAAVLFGFGRRPSLISKEHVKYVIHSNAFSSMVSTRENSSNLNSTPGFNSIFMEKSRTDWWGKFVIVVR